MTQIKSNDLYHALHRLYRQMHRFAHREIHGRREIYRGQANLLLLLAQNDGASQRELAETLDIRPSSLTEMAVKLEAAGQITRRPDENDQRVMRIYLTDEGKNAAAVLTGTTDEFTDSMFNALTDAEKEQLLGLIEKLCASLGHEEEHEAHNRECHRGSGHREGCGHGEGGGHGAGCGCGEGMRHREGMERREERHRNRQGCREV